jgi:hypothetical protein
VAAVKHPHQCPGVFFELKWRQRAPTVTQDSAAKIEFNRGCDFDVHGKVAYIVCLEMSPDIIKTPPRKSTALFAPIAIALAQALGHSPEPFGVTVAMASVVAFLTPIGHHGNLLVYGAGRYNFMDFVRVCTPLTVICALIVVLLAPLLWPG